MKRFVLTVGAWAVMLAATLYAVASLADRNVTTRIIGTDSVCSSYSASTIGNDSVLTCVPQTSPGAPTGCTASVNAGTGLTLSSAGGAANFNTGCVSPTSGVTYNWSKNSVFGASTATSWTDTLPANSSPSVNANYYYVARACTTSACTSSPPSPLVVTVLATGGSPPFSGTCPGYAATYVLPLSWSSPARLFASTFQQNDIIVLSFTTGNISSTNSLPHTVVVEYNGPPTQRMAVLSAVPCDLSSQPAPGAVSVGNTNSNLFAITNGSGFGFYPVLAKNTTYFVNIVNTAGACAANCPVSADLLKGSL
jgi:hypothetical protein